MNNNEMIKYKDNFVSKIKKFFSRLFKGKKVEANQTEEISNFNVEETVSDKKENEFFDELIVNTSDIDKVIDKKNFLEYIDGNADALNLLSVDRLRKLKEYYDNIIEKNDKIIKNLKKSEN